MSAPELDCPAGPSDTGAYQLSWSAPGEPTYRLQERELDTDRDAALLYEGPDDATTVTGRPAGAYEYRVGAVEHGATSWSEPCVVHVEPPSLELAFALFGGGAIITAGIVIAIVRGHRAHRRGVLG